MNDDIKRIERDGFVARIQFDSDPLNPREEYDNAGTIVYWSSRYIIGDVDGSREYGTPDDFMEWAAEQNMAAMLPVYAYIHSGITISTGEFGDRWDSGQVGWIYMTKETVEKEGIPDPVSYLKSEIETYDAYLTGMVYVWIIESPDGEIVESCGGYYAEDYAIEEAISALVYAVEDNEREFVETMGKLIDNC